MQERQGVVAQERDVRIICKSRQIKSVPEESGEEVAGAAGEEGQEEELYNIEVKVQREKCANGDLLRMTQCG